jgi:DNA-directed RNA polymerase specialized sigma24 family protein
LRTAQRYLAHLIDRRVAESPESTYLLGEVEARLIDALQRLSPDARAVVVMAARGISGHDIAHSIGRSDAATRTLLCRARVRLRVLLHEETLL